MSYLSYANLHAAKKEIPHTIFFHCSAISNSSYSYMFKWNTPQHIGLTIFVTTKKIEFYPEPHYPVVNQVGYKP